MGRGRLLVLIALAALGVAGPARAQCWNEDHDAFYYEQGCPTILGCDDVAPGTCGAVCPLSGQDCNDSTASIQPGAPELCNGYDDNCDGQIDEAGACDRSCDWAQRMGAVHRLTTDPASSYGPRLAWNGSEYAAVWTDWRNETADTYFTRVSANGDELIPDLRVSSGTQGPYVNAIAWTGAEYGIAWSLAGGNSASDIFFARLSAAGAKIGSDVIVSAPLGDQIRPVMAWSGLQYGLAWIDQRTTPQVYFARLDKNGQKVGTDLLVSGGSATHDFVDIAWSGCSWGIVWADLRGGVWDIYFARVSRSGQLMVTDKRITTAVGYKTAPKLVWNGSQFGCTWEDHRSGANGQVYFVALDLNGNRIFVEKPVTGPTAVAIGPSLAWSGAEYGLAWTDNRTGVSQTMFARVSTAGDRIANEVVLIDDPTQLYDARIAWTGSRYGVTAYGGTGSEVYLAIVGCNCVDDDADGLTSCDDNCPVDYNPSQSDQNHDTQGDRCDVNDGLVYVYAGDRTHIAWQQEAGPSSWSVYEGDLAVLKSTGVYTQTPGSNPLAQKSCAVTQNPFNDPETPASGKVKFALVAGTTTLTGLGTNSAGATRPNTNPCP